MLSALLAMTYNTLLGCVFDYIVKGRRTAKGWAFLLGPSVLTGAAAHYFPKIVAAVLLAGTLAYFFALRRESIRSMSRLNAKMRGLYALDEDDEDVLSLARDMQALVQNLRVTQEPTAAEPAAQTSGAAQPAEEART